MARRFTLAALLHWVTLVALLLAIVVPLWRYSQAKRHHHRILKVACSADGSTVAGQCGNGRVLFWGSNGALRATLAATAGILAISFDGSFAAVGRSGPMGGVDVWDIAKSQLVKTVPTVTPYLALSPSGNMMAAIVSKKFGGGAAIEVHPLGHGSHIARIALDCLPTMFSFSPDGKRLAVRHRHESTFSLPPGKGDYVEVFDTASGKLIQRLQSHVRGSTWIYRDLAWSPDGKRLAAIQSFLGKGHRESLLQCWKLGTSERLSKELPDGGYAYNLAYVCGGRVLATYGFRYAMLLDAGTLEPIPGSPLEDISELAADRKGDTVVTLRGGDVELWDGAALQPRQRLIGTPSPKVWPAICCLAAWFTVFGISRVRKAIDVCRTCGRRFHLTPRGRLLLTLRESAPSIDCPACYSAMVRGSRKELDRMLWPLAIAATFCFAMPICRYSWGVRTYSKGWAVAVAASADGSNLAALLHDGRMMVWHSGGIPQATLQTRGSFCHLALSSDGKFAALSHEGDVADASRTVEIWDIRSRKLLRTIPAGIKTLVAFSPVDDLLVIQDEEGATELYSVRRGGPRALVARNRMSQAFSPDGTMLAVASWSGEVEVYDIRTLRLKRAVRGERLVSRGSLAWSPDSRRLSVLGVDNHDSAVWKETLETWLIAAPDSQLSEKKVECCPFNSDGSSSRGETIAYLPDGRTLVLADGLNGSKLFDGKALQRLPSSKKTSGIWRLAAGVRGKTFLTANREGVYLWDVATLKRQRCLFRSVDLPNFWPALVCLAPWIVVVSVRRLGKRHRSWSPRLQ